MYLFVEIVTLDVIPVQVIVMFVTEPGIVAHDPRALILCQLIKMGNCKPETREMIVLLRIHYCKDVPVADKVGKEFFRFSTTTFFRYDKR